MNGQFLIDYFLIILMLDKVKIYSLRSSKTCPVLKLIHVMLLRNAFKWWTSMTSQELGTGIGL